MIDNVIQDGCPEWNNLRIEIGGYWKKESNYVQVDKFELLKPNSYPEILLSHVLEHIEYLDVKRYLTMLFNALINDGILKLYVPNGRAIGAFLILGFSGAGFVKAQTYGHQASYDMLHKNIFCAGEIKRLCLNVGFKTVIVKGSDKLKRQSNRDSYKKFTIGWLITRFFKPELEIIAIK